MPMAAPPTSTSTATARVGGPPRWPLASPPPPAERGAGRRPPRLARCCLAPAQVACCLPACPGLCRGLGAALQPPNPLPSPGSRLSRLPLQPVHQHRPGDRLPRLPQRRRGLPRSAQRRQQHLVSAPACWAGLHRVVTGNRLPALHGRLSAANRCAPAWPTRAACASNGCASTKGQPRHASSPLPGCVPCHVCVQVEHLCIQEGHVQGGRPPALLLWVRRLGCSPLPQHAAHAAVAACAPSD